MNGIIKMEMLRFMIKRARSTKDLLIAKRVKELVSQSPGEKQKNKNEKYN